MRPAVSAACRAALRDLGVEDAQQHVATCSFCAARQKATASIAGFVAKRPEMPEALRSDSLLESIYDRVSESTPQAAVSEWLEQASVPAPAGDDADWQDANWDIVEKSRRDAVDEFLQTPAQPDAQVWSNVRRSILADVANERAASKVASLKLTSLKLTSWRVLLAGAAAAAVVGLFTVSGSAPKHPFVAHPNVVFMDLDRAPDVDIARVRYGPRGD